MLQIETRVQGRNLSHVLSHGGPLVKWGFLTPGLELILQSWAAEKGENFPLPLHIEGPPPSLCLPQLFWYSWVSLTLLAVGGELPCCCSGPPSSKSWARGSAVRRVPCHGAAASCPTLSTRSGSCQPKPFASLCVPCGPGVLVAHGHVQMTNWLLQRVFASMGLCLSCCHLSLPHPYRTSPAMPSAATSFTLCFQRIQSLYPPKGAIKCRVSSKKT